MLSHEMVCFRSKFLQNLEDFSLQTPEDLVLEWFRRRNGPDDQEKSASTDPKSSTKAHVEVQTAFFGRLERSEWRLAPRFGCAVPCISDLDRSFRGSCPVYGARIGNPMRSRPKHGKESGRIERYSLKKRLQEDYRRLQEISAQSANSARRRVDHAGRPVGPHQRPGGTKATASGGRSLHTVIFSGVRPKQTPNRSRDRALDQAHAAKDIGRLCSRSSLDIVSLTRVLRIARV